jgi:hypothetical protein
VLSTGNPCAETLHAGILRTIILRFPTRKEIRALKQLVYTFDYELLHLSCYSQCYQNIINPLSAVDVVVYCCLLVPFVWYLGFPDIDDEESFIWENKNLFNQIFK